MKRIVISIAAMLMLITACSSPTPTATLVPPPTSTVTPLTSGPTLTAALAGLQATAEAIGSSAPATSESAAVGTQSALAPGGSIAILPTFTTGAPLTATGTATPAALNGALAPNQMNPCSLVTKDDVSAALGVTVQDPTVSTSSSGAVVCQFIATTNNAISAGIAVYQDASVNAADGQLAQGQTVAGLGDAAALTGQGLYVKAGNTMIVVTAALGSQTAQVSTAEQALAQKAVLNLTVF